MDHTEIINDNSKVTANSKQLELLKTHFPQCFDKDGNFIKQKMQEVVSDEGLELSKESYSLNWLGKSYARLLANENPLTLLKEDKEHNAKEQNATSQNVLIKGDNLEVLKHLSNSYNEAIKMIYIDPPYNTGSDGFVYQDDRKFTAEELSHLAGVDIEEAKHILEFTQSKANSHSAWLTFMYPRLYVARHLLKDDGVIFISIDDNEQSQLKLLCDEVFGEDNFVGSIIWKNVTDNNPTNIATEHEHIMVYAKVKNKLESIWKSKLSNIKETLLRIEKTLLNKHNEVTLLQKEYTTWFKENKFQLDTLDRYKYIDFDGIYTGSQSVHNPGKEGYRYDIIHPTTNQPCKEPLMGYRFPESTMDKLLEEGKILFGNDHNKIVELKIYAKDYLDKLPSIIELDGRLGANELRSLFPKAKKMFTNPKPTDLIKKLISFATSDTDFILDFFAGSGTTANAVMQLNVEDKGNRKYIAAQIAEPTDKKSEAYKAGYKIIFDITKARIEKAALKIAEENSEFTGDLGFKIFETIPVFDGYLDDIETLDDETTLFDGSSLNNEDLETFLTTWRVYDGMRLGDVVEELTLNDYRAYLGNGSV